MFHKKEFFVSIWLLTLGFFALGVSFGTLILQGYVIYALFVLVVFAIGYFIRHHLVGKVIMWLSLLVFVALLFEKITSYLALIAWALFVLFLVKSLMTKTQMRVQQLVITNHTSQKHAKIEKTSWFQAQLSQDSSYTFEDVHDTSMFGDTVINLTQTILSDNSPIIVLHKGFGDVRILVPLEIGVVLSSHTLYGNVFFEQEDYHLRNAKLTMYSRNYATATKKLKIVTTVYIGNVEVVYL